MQAAEHAEAGCDAVCVDFDTSKIERLKKNEIPIYGSAILTYVPRVADMMGMCMEAKNIIVAKSTVPFGTGERVLNAIGAQPAGRACAIAVDVACNPEFLKEGSGVSVCMQPDRIVVDTNSRATEEVLRELHAPFNRNQENIIVMDVRSAELTKYAAQCVVATKITLMNEMALPADRLGGGIEHVRKGIGKLPQCTGDAPARRIWGLASKPNTDDMREAPARLSMEALWPAGAQVRAYDPAAMRVCRRLYGERDDRVLTNSKDKALGGTDALVISTKSKNFRAPDFDHARNTRKQPLIFDGRNIYNPKVVARHGLKYPDIGRRQAKSSLRENPSIASIPDQPLTPAERE